MSRKEIPRKTLLVCTKKQTVGLEQNRAPPQHSPAPPSAHPTSHPSGFCAPQWLQRLQEALHEAAATILCTLRADRRAQGDTELVPAPHWPLSTQSLSRPKPFLLSSLSGLEKSAISQLIEAPFSTPSLSPPGLASVFFSSPPELHPTSYPGCLSNHSFLQPLIRPHFSLPHLRIISPRGGGGLKDTSRTQDLESIHWGSYPSSASCRLCDLGQSPNLPPHKFFGEGD